MSNTALHDFPPAVGLKEEIRNKNQGQRKIFEPGGIWTRDLRIRSSFYQLS